MVKFHPFEADATVFTWDPWGTTGRTHCNCYDYAFDSYSAVRSAKSVPGDRNGNLANNLNFRSCAGIVRRVLGDNPRNVYKLKNPYAKCKPGYYKVMCFVAPKNDFGNTTGDFHWYKHNSGVRYRTRAGDSVLGLARFFRVTPSVIRDALKKATRPMSANNGRIANANNTRTLPSLNKNNEAVKMLKSNTSIPPGLLLQFKVNLWSHKQGWATGPQLVDSKGKTIYDPIKAAKVYQPGFHYTKFCAAYAVRRGRVNTGANSNRKNGVNQRTNLNFIVKKLVNNLSVKKKKVVVKRKRLAK
jgi:hypothetical protein